MYKNIKGGVQLRKILILIVVVTPFLFFGIYLNSNKNDEIANKTIKYFSNHHVNHIELDERATITMKQNKNLFHAGMNLLLYGEQDLSHAPPLFTRLKELGVNTVAINFPIDQQGWNSNLVEINPAITPSVQSLEELIEIAHSAGLSVKLRPIIDESNLVKTGHWRGDIQPENPAEWFKNYRDILTAYAKLAERKGVELFTIGVELNNLQSAHEEEWKLLIEDIREVYDGKLIYAFNWNALNNLPDIEFVHLIDYIGIDAYFPLNVRNDATIEELDVAWAEWIKDVLPYIEDEKVLLTEVGIVPIDGAYKTPFQWIYTNRTYNPEVQVNYYESTFNSWKPYIEGIYWWTVTLDNDDENNYSPLGLPTEEVIKKQFHEIK